MSLYINVHSSHDYRFETCKPHCQLIKFIKNSEKFNTSDVVFMPSVTNVREDASSYNIRSLNRDCISTSVVEVRLQFFCRCVSCVD
jgi:hypothetical protein